MNKYISMDDFYLQQLMDKEDFDQELPDITDKDYIFRYYEGMSEVIVDFISHSAKVRAVEFMDYILNDYGKIRGDEGRARGHVSRAIVKSNMADYDKATLLELIQHQINRYINSVIWIDSREYAVEQKERIDSFPSYQKKHIAWACVDISRYLPIGSRYKLSSLENESGEPHTVNKDELIMIGLKGEVYCINREKFERSYELTDEELNIFEREFEFIPEIQVECLANQTETAEQVLDEISDDGYLTVDSLAKICFPRADSRIKAVKLNKRCKIFNEIAGEDYFLGNAGDYMAVRPEDYSDIYIIRGRVFEETYESVSM